MSLLPVNSEGGPRHALVHQPPPVGLGYDAALRDQIRNGLRRREFTLFYQPKVDMRGGTVIGLEALIRWNHPQRGLLQPAAFIPAIENHPLIESIGDWTLGEALAQASRWLGLGLRTCIAVNISARHLQRTDFLESLARHLCTVPELPSGALELELLETSPVDNREQAARVIEACRGLGIGVALDDFGTGYACLTDLRELPVTGLKLDRSFVSGVLRSNVDRAILKGIIAMANRLDIAVTAEGIESRAQGTALMALGCTIGQGYGIARPMLANYVPSWIIEYERVPIWKRALAG